MAARSSSSELDSESGGSAVLDGAGVIGDSTGITTTQFITTTGTTPGPQHSTTGTITIEEEASGASQRTWGAEKLAVAVMFTTARAEPPGLSMETTIRLEDTQNRAERAASIRTLSATTVGAEKQGAMSHA